MDKIALVEQGYIKNTPAFNVGDTIRVYIKIVEEEKTRLQAFEGLVIAKKGSGTRQTFTVRRISYGEGIERVFHINSPSVDKIELVKRGKVRRAKLYYLRRKIGKQTKVEENREGEAQEETKTTATTSSQE